MTTSTPLPSGARYNTPATLAAGRGHQHLNRHADEDAVGSGVAAQRSAPIAERLRFQDERK